MNEDVLTMLNETGEPSASAPEQPHEQDDFDQIINDVLYDEETPDQRKTQEPDELDDDDDLEGQANEESFAGQPQESSNKRPSKTRDRVVRTARQRDEARAKAMEAELKAHEERERRIAAEERYKVLQHAIGLDDKQAQQFHHEQSYQQQPQQGATFTAEDVEKMIEARFSAREKLYTEAEKVKSEIYELQDAWKENFERTKKSASHVANWFQDEFTKGIGANEKKRELLRAVSAFKYATEALYAASQKDGFERLPLGSQFKIVHELSNKIDARANQKRTQKKESIELPAHSSGSAPTRQRTVTLGMDAQSIVNAMFSRPNPQQQRSR